MEAVIMQRTPYHTYIEDNGNHDNPILPLSEGRYILEYDPCMKHFG